MDLTTKQFAQMHKEKANNIRQLCERGRIKGAYKIDGPSHGIWLIPKGSVITKYKRGRKEGWRKDGS